MNTLNHLSVMRQRGVVLIVVLIALVSMMLAAIALTHSVQTTNLIAGNLAMRQSALYQSDVGAEAAVTWLQANNTAGALDSNITASAYFATRADPGSGQTWDSYWQTVLDSAPIARPVSTAALSHNVWTLPTDPTTGNTVSYVIHRMCVNPGPSTAGGCSYSPVSSTSTQSSKTAGTVQLQQSAEIYYRITVRTDGPRGTVSYTQTIVAM